MCREHCGKLLIHKDSHHTQRSPSNLPICIFWSTQHSEIFLSASRYISSMREHYQQKWEDVPILLRQDASNWDYCRLFLSSCSLQLCHTASAKWSRQSSELHLRVLTVMVTKPDHQYLRNKCFTACFQMFLLSLSPSYLKSQQDVIYSIYNLL